MEKLTDSKISQLELNLEKDPFDINSRLTLLHHYLRPRSQTNLLIRLGHIIWMIDNVPEREECRSPLCFLNSQNSEDQFALVQEHWLVQVDKYPMSADVHGNAGYFILFQDIDLGLSLLKQACLLDPQKSTWPYFVSQLCWLKSINTSEPTNDNVLAEQIIDFGERALNSDNSEDLALKLMTLAYMALSAIHLGEYDKAKSFASKHKKLASSFDITSEMQMSQAVRGLVALRTGDLNAAKKELAQVDHHYVPGLATLRFVRELLEGGETETVLQFLDSVKTLKSFPQARKWIRAIKRKEIPTDLGTGDG
jgi:hypothetical protein